MKTQDTEDVVARLKDADESYYDRVAKQHYFSERDVKRETQSLSDRIDVLEEALKPFADCVDQIADDEDDEEWAKFRLLIKNYRRARAALHQETASAKD